ncbi:MAG TPA: hypothetical protein VFJ24_00830 [Gaiellales bacterium]|nr:hypothetical protein [Gaiellales bacterium]
MKRLLAGAVVCLAMAWAMPVAAQLPLLQQPGQPAEILDPQGLQPVRKAPLTILPSLTITGEYNDNIFLDNKNRASDFILGFTPGIAVTYERPTYRLSAGYNFTAELFADHTEESHAFDRQNFWADTKWRIDPHVTLSANDAFIYSTDTNLVSSAGVSSGRHRSYSNNLAAGVGWELDPLWTVRFSGSYTLERFGGSGLEDSDVYHVGAGVERRVTRQLTAIGTYDFGYFDIESESKFTTHTPKVGGRWQATDTITLTLTAGPSFELREDGQTHVTPAITAGYAQRLSFGAVGLAYDRSIGTAAGLGGPTDNDQVTGYLIVNTLLRGLSIQLLPRYTVVESPHSDRIDIRAFTAALYAAYRLTDWMSLVGGYQFFHQRSDSTAVTNIGLPIANDADQNRVFFGVQFGYPIRID